VNKDKKKGRGVAAPAQDLLRSDYRLLRCSDAAADDHHDASDRHLEPKPCSRTSWPGTSR
jgi:hypothetical protein